jgi:hypothetical protein
MTVAAPGRRVPTEDDLILLARALQQHRVEYVLIGGAAMALHGFPRMTKDIDLFLPVDPENNRRLLEALKSVPNSEGPLAELRPQYMDQGYSSSFEGDIAIDLLYVAASKAFGDLRGHVKTVAVGGVPVSTLDVDGMLISKRTTRPEDVPDRLKLERLRNALYDKERARRIGKLHDLISDPSEAARLVGAHCIAALSQASGVVDWKAVEARIIDIGVEVAGIDGEELADTLCSHSPGAVAPGRQTALREAIRSASATHRNPHAVSPSPGRG